MSSAAINGVTGINGSGKTLWLLQHVEKIRKESIAERWPEKHKDASLRGKLRWPPSVDNPAGGRRVYYYAIPGIKEAGVLPWTELEPFDKELNRSGMENPMAVFDLPLGSIVVIDESHRTYGNVRMGQVTPPHMVPFDMVRHKGYTFFFCTQRAKDIHPYIRERWGKHYHLRRAWGLEQSSLFEWEEAGDPKSIRSLKDAQEHTFRFPKEVYDWYRSSDSHTVQKTIPWRKLSMLVWGPVLVVLIGWLVWHRLHSGVPAADKAKPDAAPTATPSKSGTALATHREDEASTWLDHYRERVKGMPMSAEAYDAVYKPRAYPRISGCMDVKIGNAHHCTCQTQQATTIVGISESMCLFVIKNGVFDAGLPDDLQRQAHNDTPPASLALTAPPN